MNAKSIGIFGLLVALCIFMAVMSGGTFLQANNIENLLRRTAMYGILGIGVAFVIITSGIDLSIGSIVCLSGCLLALFLNVDYRPFDYQPVYQVFAKEQVILVEGESDKFEAGNRIRYFGGRRARPAIVSIDAVDVVNVALEDGEPVLSGGGPTTVRVTQIKVDAPLSRNDDQGQIAKAYTVKAFDSGDMASNETVRDPSVTLAGDHTYLRARDQIVFVRASGLKQLTVTNARASGPDTVVSVSTDLGSTFTTEWEAIPLDRRQRMTIPVALASVLVIAIGLGLVHGLLVTKIKLPPFVVTLCGLLIYRGISRWLVNDQPVGFGNEFRETLSPLGSGKVMLTESFGLPYPFFILLIVATVAAIFLNKTIWGRYMLALGRNEEAARYSGINTGQVTMIAYIISTGLAATGGMLFALDSNSISPSSFGNFFELYAIAAAVLGGCSLRGGEGAIIGVIIGTAVMQILNNLILLLRISDELEFAIIGMVILIGVVADEMLKRVAAARRATKQAQLAGREAVD